MNGQDRYRDSAHRGSAEAMSTEELVAIHKRLRSAGLFAAHAYTDVRRLLAEVHQLRRELATAQADGQAGIPAPRASEVA